MAERAQEILLQSNLTVVPLTLTELLTGEMSSKQGRYNKKEKRDKKCILQAGKCVWQVVEKTANMDKSKTDRYTEQQCVSKL